MNGHQLDQIPLSNPRDDETIQKTTSSTDELAGQSDIFKHGSGQSSSPLNLVMQFFATASNETIVLVLGLGALVFSLVFGRIGLVVISLFFGYLWGRGANHDRPRSLSGFVVQGEPSSAAVRLFDWPERPSLHADPREGDFGFAAFPPLTAAAMKTLTDCVIKDYVKYWYGPMLPSEPVFPLACEKILAGFMVSASSHLARKRTADTFLQFLMNSSSIIIVFLNELALAFQDAEASSMPPEQAVQRYLDLHPNSSLANVLDKQQQQKKLRMVSDDILSTFLDQREYGSSAVRLFLREVFAGLIFEPTITNLARPESINGWIVYLLEDGESEIMSAIDAGVEGATRQAPGVSKILENARTFAASPPVTAQVATPVTVLTKGEPTDAEISIAASKLNAERSSPATTADGLLNGSHQVAVDDPSLTNGAGGITSPATIESGTMDDLVGGEQLIVTDEPITRARSSTVDVASNQQSPFLSLLSAWVSVDDGSDVGDNTPLKSKPISDYFLQIEPASSRASGWMIFRKYTDFESLHETLDTIARLNNILSFREKHGSLPSWKGQTRKLLARSLEQYLQDALRHESLANSPRMRRFLEKDGGVGAPGAGSPARTGFPFKSSAAFETMGKGVLDALTNAPKGVAGGSRAVLDGVTGVFGSVTGASKRSSSSLSLSKGRPEPIKAPKEIPASPDAPLSGSIDMSMPRTSETFSYERPTSSEITGDDFSESDQSSSKMFGAVTATDPANISATVTSESLIEDNIRPSVDGAVSRVSFEAAPKTPEESTQLQSPPTDADGKAGSPITSEETQIAVELIFAVINELYTLSSAWNIRRALLNTAKSFILRPGSPTLETIRSLLQESMIDAHTTDEALSGYLQKLRENALPTEEEFKSWPPGPDEAEKQHLRDTARKLFLQRGLPQALMSIMGAGASREALEKIFDCLQVEMIARGFVYSLMLQAVKAIVM